MRCAGAAGLLIAVAALTAGCFGGTARTKAGGEATRTITLTMATPDAPDADAEYFIRQVASRTAGRVRISQVGKPYASVDPNNEFRLVRDLRRGKVKIAYLPSRAWERDGLTGFRVLQAPFLITDYALLRRVAMGSVGHEMLMTLDGAGLVGLGLVPDELRRPLGRRPLVSPATFRGARIRVATSPTSELVLRTLGARSVTSLTSVETGSALEEGRIDGVESSTHFVEGNRYERSARYLTSNLVLFTKMQTIVISRRVFRTLSRGDRSALRAAAAATVAHANPAGEERAEVARLCRQGLRLVPASAVDLASLRRAAAPAYAALRRDPLARREIAEVARLREQTRTAATTLPACAGGAQAATRPRTATRSAGIEGTYSMSASNAEIEAAPNHEPGSVDNWGSFTLVLRAGRFRFSDHRPAGAEPSVGCRTGGAVCAGGETTGRYAIRGTRIEFRQDAGTGDTPMGDRGDNPIVCQWSLYREALTFHLITNLPPTLDAGPPLLYVKPWRRAG